MVVMASIFTMIIIATRQVVRVSSPGDIVLMLLVGDVGSSLDGFGSSGGSLSSLAHGL